RDKAANVYLEYARGRKSPSPLVIEAHMDHPGFVTTRQQPDGSIHAEFRGGVRPSHFQGARAKFWVNEPVAVKTVKPVPANGRWVVARVRDAQPRKKMSVTAVRFFPIKEKLPAGTL